MSRQLVYSGAHPEIYVIDGDDEITGLEEVRQGVPVSVSDALAEKLLEQDVWSEVPAASPAKQPAKPVQTNVGTGA